MDKAKQFSKAGITITSKVSKTTVKEIARNFQKQYGIGKKTTLITTYWKIIKEIPPHKIGSNLCNLCTSEK